MAIRNSLDQATSFIKDSKGSSTDKHIVKINKRNTSFFVTVIEFETHNMTMWPGDSDSMDEQRSATSSTNNIIQYNKYNLTNTKQGSEFWE